MLFHNLTKEVDLRIASGHTAAGTSTINGTAIDTNGYDGICFVVLYGTLTATQVTQMKAQQGAASNGSDAADIANSHTGLMKDADSNTLQAIDIYKPTNRYVRPVVLRGTANAEVLSILAILYHNELAPSLFADATVATIAGSIVTLAQPQLGTA
jgi:hypothetical protein